MAPSSSLLRSIRKVLFLTFEGAVSQKHFNKQFFPGLGSLAKPKKVVDQKTELTDEVSSIIKLYQEEMAKQMEKFVGVKVEDIDWAKHPFKESTSLVGWKDSIVETVSALDTMKNPCGEVTIGSSEENKIKPPPEENMGLTLSSMKKTKPKKKAPKKPGPKPTEIFQWQMHSKKEVAGVKATYTTILRSDGTLACNCPGWVFKKKGQDERSCKHTTLVEIESKELFKKWKKGEKLGEAMVDAVPVSSAPSHKPVLPTTKYGRILDIE